MSKRVIIIQTFSWNIKKNNKFVIVVDKIDNETYVLKIIDCINQFKLLFENNVVVFEKNIDFTYNNLIKTFDIVVYLKIFSNNWFKSNILLSDIFYKIFVEIFFVVVNANSNTFIYIMFNTIKKKFE